MVVAATSTAAARASPAVAGETVRLYISPLTPALVSTFLPESLLRAAGEVEFRSIETFPERSYGYVDLPPADATKLKQKLNGSILKGMKLRVEDARPDTKKRRVEEELENGRNGASDDVEAPVRRSKRTKKQDGVLAGVELEAGRHVKRAWKNPDAEKGKHKKSKEGRRSKGDSKGDLVFRTSLPSNTISDTVDTGEGKGKKRKRDDKSSRKTEVKEFENTTKFPSFIRDSSDASAGKGGSVAYEDGKGWVDEHGNVVDDYVPPSKGKSPTPAISIQAPDDEVTTTTTSEEIKVSKEKSPEAITALRAAVEATLKTSPERDTPAKELHPLEAIFKRPAPKPAGGKGKSKSVLPAPIDTSFSFFGEGSKNGASDDDEEESTEGPSLPIPPQTPYTRRDLEDRGIRSAAPTPDTAAIGRRFNVPWAEDEDDDEVESDRQGSIPRASEDKSPTPQKPAADVTADEPAGQTDFEKHFYEHRGEYNRHWKQRKREARKAVRQSENRKRGGRA